MEHTDNKRKKAAKKFAEFWKGKGYEKGESAAFWISLLKDVFQIDHPEQFISFEQQVKLDHTAFIDAFIPSTHVMIEQKSIEKDLGAPVRQSDGSSLTPFQQAKRYAAELPYSQRPRWIVTCNFREFWIYDMEQPHGEPYKVLLQNLEKEYYRLQFLVDEGNAHLKRELEVSVKAGDLVGVIYDKLLAQYLNPNDAETLHSLNVLCVRLVFCLYAEDAMLFGSKTAFHDYLSHYEARDIRRALISLFDVLDTPIDKRDPYLEDNLKAFPYVNGGLFGKDEQLVIPQFTDELKELLLTNASDDFDWGEISPTIFGAVFESTLNPDTRRKGGMHYTSIENIHKVIDPLFFNGLVQEFKRLKKISNKEKRRKELYAFQERIASLVFLDPACGSGNFLTETYLSLRRLENAIIKELYGLEAKRDFGFEGKDSLIKVGIHQFYGIEINDFAVDVATTAMWIAENQMLQETENITGCAIEMLPLKSYLNIRKGNALRVPWDEWEITDNIPTIFAKNAYIYPTQPEDAMIVSEPTITYNDIDIHADKAITYNVPKKIQTRVVHFDYIMGNPPFIGARMMNAEQKEDMIHVFGKQWKNIGNMDYVCSWYYKAAKLAQQDEHLRVAFVSTNSITQGEQVANLWKPIMETLNGHIDFAFRTFRWDSESTLKAHVHCVIIGFSCGDTSHPKLLFDSQGTVTEVAHINGYLADMPDVFVGSRTTPLCAVPQIGIGNKPIDDGNYLFTEDEMKAFIQKEPKAEKYFRKWIGADEFINRWCRYCLWIGDCTPDELRKMPNVVKRVQAVRSFRLNSKSDGTKKLADRPTRFHVENMPEGNYLLIPRVSSEKRKYVPIGFIDSSILSSDSVHITESATLYHFGILTSSVHNAWMRMVAGRLKSDYRYSKDIVYNNFPWPQPTDKQIRTIEETAQAILSARALYPNSSLADLYDDVIMPIELRKAHQANDKAVMQAYGFSTKMTENEIVSALFKIYQELVENE